jgi:[citrate (pro-3S)-lyase] ligase
MFTIKDVVLEDERNLLISFLRRYGLEYEHDITYSALVYDGDQLVATGSLAHNIMKCFLVHPDHQKRNLTNVLFHHMVRRLEDQGIDHYFVYTLPKNAPVFQSLHMTKIVETMNTILLEGGRKITDVLQGIKTEYQVSDNKKGCVIINANPMTNGHLHLIETAAKQHEELLVFVVSEDLSSFPFADRFAIIQKATAHLPNVTVVPTSSYLVSRITFPKYFLKDDQLIQDEQTLIDVLVYKQYYTKIFQITRRYVGEEPFSATTAKYNQVLKDHLGQHLVIIPRKEHDQKPISASMVRRLIKADKLDKVRPYVPQATMDYLTSDAGRRIVELIRSSTLGRH